MSTLYYYAVGLDSRGTPSVSGPFGSYDEAKDAQSKIPQITEIKELPTRNIARAKQMLRYQQTYGTGSLDEGMKNIKGYEL